MSISRNALSYLAFSQGYRGVAFNGQAYNGPVELTFTQPEKLSAYEIGLKSESYERRLQINAAGTQKQTTGIRCPWFREITTRFKNHLLMGIVENYFETP